MAALKLMTLASTKRSACSPLLALQALMAVLKLMTTKRSSACSPLLALLAGADGCIEADDVSTKTQRLQPTARPSSAEDDVGTKKQHLQPTACPSSADGCIEADDVSKKKGSPPINGYVQEKSSPPINGYVQEVSTSALPSQLLNKLLL